ncbi:hypothetical protein PtA15_11A521 [Puccinia triticina]|uniref:DUF7872 domain-containing protein n=1 Tax=Puccinia triticina TaxID=208348 RepID=A0ABY7CY08_9BASI|nr:uncharacterized protein PtA15_11A521 [Puccinia triticina]WAQ89830.1 hypothetical protein PtA15_11A521 [Puccinia triticina]
MLAEGECQTSSSPSSPSGSGNITPSFTTPATNNSSTLADFRYPCARLPLMPDSWQSLDLDNYLRNFPGGKNLSLELFAEKVGATNFECGIGKMCDANQICLPVRGRDWYILVAAQNWNSFSNQMYQATGFALSVVGGLCGAIPGFVIETGFAFLGSTLWPFIQGGTGFIAGLINTYHNLIATLPNDEFSKTKDVQFLLSNAQMKAQAQFSNEMKKIIDGGISTEEGLYGALQGGTFLNDKFFTAEYSEDEIKNAISAVGRARLIAAVWKATKPCTQDGPDGAFPDEDVLSYCSPDGMMMNIVQSHGGKLLERFPSAPLLSTKYNLTTRYFVEHSWDCQQKYGSYNYDPYKNKILPANPDAECVVSLAVCDMTRKDIQKAAKRKGVLKACREIGQLPKI